MKKYFFLIRKTVWLLLAYQAFADNILAQQVYNIPLAQTSGKQTIPRIIAAGSQGGAFVYWLDTKGTSNEIFAQYLAPGGRPVWPDGKSLVKTTGNIANFDVIADGDNGAYLSYQEDDKVFIARMRASGDLAWPNPIRLGPTTRRLANPRVVTDFARGAYVVWEHRALLVDLFGQTEIAAQHVDADGKFLWSANGVDIIRAQGEQHLSDAISTSEALVVAWDDARNNKVLVEAYKFSNGDPFSNTGGIVPSFSSGKMTSAKMVISGLSSAQPSVIVIWEDDRNGDIDLYGQMLTFDGQRGWGDTGEPIIKNSGDQTKPQILSDSQGGAIAVWLDTRNGGPDLYAQRMSSTGDKLWRAVGVSLVNQNGSRSEFDIAGDLDDGVYCVWEDDRAGDKNLYAQHLDKNGKLKWAQSGLEITTQPNAQLQPTAVTLSDKRMAIAWDDERDGSPRIFAQMVLPEGKLDNLLPTIDSTPDTLVNAGERYEYAVRADDIDRDFPLVFTLAQAPQWLTIDTSSGVVSGVAPQTTNALRNPVEIVATDARGGKISQKYNLTIKPGQNSPPRFTSVPDTTVFEDSTYIYQIVFVDPDAGDRHTLTIESLPIWLQFDTTKALISGIPRNEDVGEYTIRITVSDGFGESDVQQFHLEVINTNDPPQFIASLTDTTVFEDALFIYTVQAQDPDKNEQLRFGFVSAPRWLAIDAVSGAMTGTPANSDVGDTTVTIWVEDQAAATDTQTFKLTVQNVNDPPYFVSSPDTIAHVDSLYTYAVKVADVDKSDTLTVVVHYAPHWLVWQAEGATLSGRPPLSAVGDTTVALRVHDLAGRDSLQVFGLHVIADAVPDTVAPGAPAMLTVSPVGWTANEKMTLRWQRPFDQSGIAAAFVKIGSPPQDSSEYDIVQKMDQSISGPDSLQFSAPREGHVPVYLWFRDGVGNVDVKKTASVFYKLDRTPPSSPVGVLPDRWVHGDTVRFAWTAAADTISAVAAYSVHIPSLALDRTVSADTLHLDVLLDLQETAYTWAVDAIDSAGNVASSRSRSFTVDYEPPEISVSAADTVSQGVNFVLTARCTDGTSGIARVEAWHRTAGATAPTKEAMNSKGGGNFELAIPAQSIEPAGFEYTVLAADSAGNATFLLSHSNFTIFKSVVVASSTVQAPAPTAQNKYQMVSVPFHVMGATTKTFFEKNFGSYDDTVWRLLRYQNGAYAELSSGAIDSLSPGRAFWLITKEPKSWGAEQVVSVNTAEEFPIALQPGWNMVALPYAFPVAVDSPMIKIPEGVERHFWGYDGNSYVLEQENLQPWRGYFLNNLTNTVQALVVRSGSAQPHLNKPNAMAAAMQWLLRLGVECNGGADATNFLGVSQAASDAYDFLDISEPPAIGAAPRLYFPHREWTAFAGEYAGDIRRETTNDLAWDFVVDNLSGGEMKLQLFAEKELPDSLCVVLSDRTTGIRKVWNPGTIHSVNVGRHQPSRSFKLEILPEADVENLHAIPQVMKLYPAWPNPFRTGTGKNLVLRFALTSPGAVEMRIYNILGQLVWQTQAGGRLPAGEHALIWGGQASSDTPVANGVYIVSLVSNGRRLQQKILVLQ